MKVPKEIYVMMQGPSEFGASGRLANWDIKDRLEGAKDTDPDGGRKI